jgi:hypothetical protein
MSVTTLLGHGIKAAVLVTVLSTAAWAQSTGPCIYDVPEIDPSAVPGALALLAGGVFLIADRFRRH